MSDYELRGHGANDKGEDFDLICGAVRIELDRAANGRWRFWNVILPDGSRFGGSQILGPEEAAWLERERESTEAGS